MEWLSIWLKKLILLIMLAAFLDLILPNTQLQKYVKLVMGLMILFAILTPVFSLFQFSPEELADRLDRYQEQFTTPAPARDWRQLNGQLQEGANRQVTAFVEREMADQIREQVAAYGKEVVSVDVGWRRGGGTYPEISSISIELGEGPKEGAKPQAIKPVEPVRVVLAGAGESADALPASRPAEEPVHRLIAEAVAQAWGVKPEQIRVTETARDDP